MVNVQGGNRLSQYNHNMWHVFLWFRPIANFLGPCVIRKAVMWQWQFSVNSANKRNATNPCKKNWVYRKTYTIGRHIRTAVMWQWQFFTPHLWNLSHISTILCTKVPYCALSFISFGLSYNTSCKLSRSSLPFLTIDLKSYLQWLRTLLDWGLCMRMHSMVPSYRHPTIFFSKSLIPYKYVLWFWSLYAAHSATLLANNCKSRIPLAQKKPISSSYQTRLHFLFLTQRT